MGIYNPLNPTSFGPSSTALNGLNFGPNTFAPSPNPNNGNPTNPPAESQPQPAPVNPLAMPQGLTSSPYDQSVSRGGWNPYQYATNETTNRLAQQFGGQATKTAAASGPFAIPQQNSIDFGNGWVGNAGLTQQLLDSSGSLGQARMDAMRQTAAGGTTGIGTDPSLVGYRPTIQGFQPPAQPQAPQAPAQTPTQAGGSGQNPLANSPFGQQQLLGLLLPFLLGGGMGGGGGFANSYGLGGNQFGGVAALLNLIQGLQSGSGQVTPAATPNTNLYYPQFS